MAPSWPPSGMVPLGLGLGRVSVSHSASTLQHSSTPLLDSPFQRLLEPLSGSHLTASLQRGNTCQSGAPANFIRRQLLLLILQAAPAPDPTIVPVPALTCTSTNQGNLSIKGPTSKQTDSNKAAGWRCNNNNSGWCNLPDSPKNRWWRGQLSRAINQHTLDSREQTDSNRA